MTDRITDEEMKEAAEKIKSLNGFYILPEENEVKITKTPEQEVIDRFFWWSVISSTIFMILWFLMVLSW
jgi:hypothetical protein